MDTINMSDAIRICTEMSVEPEMLAEAQRLAIAENKENASLSPVGARSMDDGKTILTPSPLIAQIDGSRDQARLALLHGKKWAPGRTLNIRFLNGSSFVQDKVKQFASLWQHFANIKFNFNGGTNSEIRISFNAGGSYSYLGTDALTRPSGSETMNFGWFNSSTMDQEFSRTTVHEFGHALGCIHEHQNPSVSIPWDKPAVYQYYAQTQNPPWTVAKVDNNIFKKYGTDVTQFTQFDAKSIMCYAVPNSLTIGNYEIGWNTVLSESDKSFISVAYPFPDAGPFAAGWYRLTNSFLTDSRALDTYSNANNAPFMGQAGNYSGQYWSITPAGQPGFYRLSNYFLGTGRSLDTYSNGNNVPFMGTTGNSSGQLWKIIALGGGYYRLTNAFLGIGRSLDTYSDGSNAPFMGQTGNYSGQYWKLTKIA
jgi:serralysin